MVRFASIPKHILFYSFELVDRIVVQVWIRFEAFGAEGGFCSAALLRGRGVQGKVEGHQLEGQHRDPDETRSGWSMSAFAGYEVLQKRWFPMKQPYIIICLIPVGRLCPNLLEHI